MIKHTFIEKSVTIFKDKKVNTGLNPVVELNCGGNISRILLWFDLSELKKCIEDKTCPDVKKFQHILHMTNCFSIDGLPYEKTLSGINCFNKNRAASFDVVLFKLPCRFDAGRGFDFNNDFWIEGKKAYNESGANWFQASNGLDWDEPGVYSNDTLTAEYTKFSKGEDSLVIARQHFDFGNEDLDIDITDYVNALLTNEIDLNYGIGLAFSPERERLPQDIAEYVGFFTDHTNTFFHPYIQTTYMDFISDDRASFHIGKENKLYLYCNENNEPLNLDNIPICTINDKEYPVEQVTKGVYCARISPLKGEMDSNTIYYDNWSNLALNGEKIDDVEMEFVALSNVGFRNIGNTLMISDTYVPTLSGINDDEKLRVGEVRNVLVDFRQQYTTNKKILIDGAEYRLYVKDANREIDIVNYAPIEKTFIDNFFVVDTRWLIPNNYHIDVRVKRNGEIRYYKDCLYFTVVSELTEKYV